MLKILDTTVGDHHLLVNFVAPKKVKNQFDFIEVYLDNQLIDMSNGFVHGTKLREQGVLCKQTCIGINHDLILTVADSKKLLTEFNVQLFELAMKDKIPYRLLEMGSWRSGEEIQSIDVDSNVIQAMYFYFKRAANASSPDHVLCNPSKKLLEEEKIFLGEFLTHSPYLLSKAEQQAVEHGVNQVMLEAEDVNSSLQHAVIQINNRRYGVPSVMDAKHPILSPLFKDTGPVFIDMDDDDIPL